MQQRHICKTYGNEVCPMDFGLFLVYTCYNVCSFKVCSRFGNPVLSYLLHSGPEVGAISHNHLPDRVMSL